MSFITQYIFIIHKKFSKFSLDKTLLKIDMNYKIWLDMVNKMPKKADTFTDFLLKEGKKYTKKQKMTLIVVSAIFLFFGGITLWVATLKMPDLNNLETNKISQSTKIFDRTGKILLYDVHKNAKRTVIPYEQISKELKNATVAIEDSKFYEHHGIKLSSIIRSVFVNILAGGFTQGGSTITQQVIKNSLLTTEKTITRKIKEWVLAIELERSMSKDEILSLYLNGNPYGGNIYGVEEASQGFFAKSAAEVSLAEAAYLAAIPKAPTYYSPYGSHRTELDTRQKLVLSEMLNNKFITKAEYDNATKEKVVFQPKATLGIKAPHFVEFIRQYLADKYGDYALETEGYKVITTLDYDLQAKSEEIAKKYGLSNEKNFNGKNTAAIAIDPKTGQILTMVGSRDYFDKSIEGNFNVTVAHRQPGSTFKPFVYATAFELGYTPETILYDVPTEFSVNCSADSQPLFSSAVCYNPENYDGEFLGPINLRNALAQSRNIPAIKLLYLAGIKASLQTAKDLGIKTLSDDPNQYGLTLVLGGGEVSLLDLTSAYGVFANDGVRNSYTGILSIDDSKGNRIEEFKQSPDQVIGANIAETISDILADNVAKMPAYGVSSPLFFANKHIASKTGTTNNFKDAWTIGYTPEIAVGVWAGNNDNTPMEKKVAGLIIAPMWHEIMEQALATYYTGEDFNLPPPLEPDTKPELRGIYSDGGFHEILYYVDKNNPTGPAPINPSSDSQFDHWEYGVQQYYTNYLYTYQQPVI